MLQLRIFLKEETIKLKCQNEALVSRVLKAWREFEGYKVSYVLTKIEDGSRVFTLR